jgi:hypothetical protein
MKMARQFRPNSFVVALHLLGFNLGTGSWHPSFIYGTVLSAFSIWGAAFYLEDHLGYVAIVASAIIALIVHNVALHAWQSELDGMWRPSIQFVALHYLIAMAIGRSSPSSISYRGEFYILKFNYV